MKRCLFCFSVLLLLALPAWLAAQPVRKEIRWQEVPNSGGYQVEIQSLDSGRTVVQAEVLKPPFTISLEPGNYRLRIITLNRWGQPEASSDWVQFQLKAQVQTEPEAPPESAVRLLEKKLVLDPVGMAVITLSQADNISQETSSQGIAAHLIMETAEKNSLWNLYPQPETLQQEVVPVEDQIIVPRSAMQKTRTIKLNKSHVYSELILLNLPKWQLYNNTLPYFYPLLKFRAGVQDLAPGLSFGYMAEAYSLTFQTQQYKNLETYNIPESSIHSLEISYKLQVTPNFYIAGGVFPIAMLYRILAITYNDYHGVDFVAPMNFIKGSEELEVVIPDAVKSNQEFFQSYISTWHSIWGAFLSLEYSIPQVPLLINVSSNFWVSYSQFDIVDWTIEASVGLRLSTIFAELQLNK